ncbi:THAP domain-containing protein 2-like [Bombyx mandarina]|uniref:THAP domain-containing protein 2-like n=1 Tax=Bombyx mandarina TaxID=7092 RepID=A0A6J2KB25_BOMMA|nr:THAP domain-containing protein 2-like [Bombyx mandarina]
MPVCSVVGCGIRKTPNRPSLTIHRIPRNEHIKNKWLEAIGKENLKSNVKDLYICSLHFDDKFFNKTLNVTRLRDDAVPFKFVRVS